MKKAINLIITYFLFLFLGLFFGIILYSIYLNTLNFVSGSEIKLFSIKELLRSGIYVAYCLVFLVCPMICYYRLRHPAGLPQTIAYVIVCLITWLLLFPGLYYADRAFEKKINSKYEQTYLSQGYFRPGDEKVYFFTKDFEKNNKNVYSTTGVVLDTSEDGEVLVDENIKNDFRLEVKELAYPYKEVQLKKIFEKKGKSIPVEFSILISVAKKSFRKGFLSYLNFLSIALLICVLYLISTFFDWRLLNTTLIFFFTTIILTVNSIYYSSIFSEIRREIISIRFFEALGKYVDEPLIFVMNNLVSIILIVIWIVRFAVKKHKNKNR